MRIWNVLSNEQYDSLLDGPNGNVLNYTDAQIAQLPTITQLVRVLQQFETMAISNGVWQESIPMPKPIAVELGMRSPFAAYLNNATNDEFVVNRLGSGRFCLKPNLAHRPILYRGQNTMYKRIESTFYRPDKDGLDAEKKLVSNLRYAEFMLLLKTHPLFRLFDAGIRLEVCKETMFFEMNYYGLAQHYGFNTGLIDFSSDINVSSFFACTKCAGYDKYEEYSSSKASSYGVIYAFPVDPQTTFKGPFSSIGLQVYPRSGAQKGFLQQTDVVDINKMSALMAFPFRHDDKEDKKVFDYWKGGKLIFPTDELSPIAQKILYSNQISLSAFTYNLYINPRDTMPENLEKCKRYGVTINPNLHYVFTRKLLETYYTNMQNGWWENFCNQIYFGCDEKSEKMKASMLSLPQNPHYLQYFEERYYDLLYYHQNWEESKAHRKVIR